MNTYRRTTFKELRELTAEASTVRLQKKIQRANAIAKLAATRQDRQTAYQSKDAIINHGLHTGLLDARSDEQGRNHLILVGTRRGRVHMPVHRLTRQSRHADQVRAVLGIQARDAA
ncbi:hypothetical protein OAF82_00420 [bacterium]|nr:hypothetical protein [bacterium]